MVVPLAVIIIEVIGYILFLGEKGYRARGRRSLPG
jgi:hypothetical protein